MKWTRRNFMTVAAAVGGALGLGVKASSVLEGRAYFEDWRALPGMMMTLHLDVADPEETRVTLVAKHDGQETTLDTLEGASELAIRVPFIETEAESFDLTAIVSDRSGRRCVSEPLEVLSGSFHFGM